VRRSKEDILKRLAAKAAKEAETSEKQKKKKKKSDVRTKPKSQAQARVKVRGAVSRMRQWRCNTGFAPLKPSWAFWSTRDVSRPPRPSLAALMPPARTLTPAAARVKPAAFMPPARTLAPAAATPYVLQQAQWDQFEQEAAPLCESDVETGLDVVFVIDVTGSMSCQIEGVKQMVHRYCQEHGGAAARQNVRIHIVTYTEDSRQGYTSHYTSTSPVRLAEYVNTLRVSTPPGFPGVSAHGGDGEENVLHALAAMFREPGGRRRVPLERRVLCFVITDAPPHNKQQHNGEALAERRVLQDLDVADDDGGVDMYRVLDRVLDQRQGRIVFVPIMYGVRGEDLHFYAQAALLTQGMVLRARGTDSSVLAASLSRIVAMMQALLGGGGVDIPSDLPGFECLRIDCLDEAASEEDARVPPPEEAGDVHQALVSLLDSVREIGSRRWAGRQPEDDESTDSEAPAEAEGGVTAPPAVERPAALVSGEPLALACEALGGDGCMRVRPKLTDGSLAPVEMHLSAARLRGLDPGLGGTTRPVISVELRGSRTEEQRQPVDMVLAIDVSYSMHGVIPLVRETMHQVYGTLRGTDQLAIVTFSKEAQLILPLTPKAKISNWSGFLEKLRAQTSTNIEGALRLSFNVLKGSGRDAARSGCLVMLSDGMPNVGRKQAPRLYRLAKRLARGRGVTIYSLGFTALHDVTLMSALPRASSGTQGSYYYLGAAEDIAASVGDALGDLRPAVCEEVALAQRGPAACCWYGPGAMDEVDSVPLLALRHEAAEVGVLRALERQVRVLVCPEDFEDGALELTWRLGAQRYAATVHLRPAVAAATAPLDLSADDASLGPLGAAQVHVLSHVLRLRVASALIVLAGTTSADVGHHDVLHGHLVCCLTALESLAVEEGDATFLEGMLQSLERDLGEALAHRQQGAMGAEERALLLKFAQEHFKMHSASSLTHIRAAYASQEQIRMRLRFLQSLSEAGGEEKLELPLEEPDLPAEELECRKRAEEHACFVTLSTWREGVLGIGLFVHPRTLRERKRNLFPEVDLVLDYVSAEAYNLGVRAAPQSAGADEVVDDDEAGPRAEVLTSSSRKRINAWLPLFINKANWRKAATYAASAFSIIATQLNAAFRPSDALAICSRLICCVVVGFVHPSKDGSEQQRARASDVGVQMFCDVHRLFLKMAETYPEIRATALEAVQSFIQNSASRTRRQTPNLGDLISYLCIIDEYAWEDLAPALVPELLRRAVGRFREPLDPHRSGTVPALIARFDHLEPEHGLVVLFTKVFCEEVARPRRPWQDAGAGAGEEAGVLPCAAVCEMYDRRWGQLPLSKRVSLLGRLQEIRDLQSVAGVLRALLPFEFTDEDACELILWASKHGQVQSAIASQPSLTDIGRKYCTEWRRDVEGHQRAEAKIDALLAAGHSPELTLRHLLQLAAGKWEPEAEESLQPFDLSVLFADEAGGTLTLTGIRGATARELRDLIGTELAKNEELAKRDPRKFRLLLAGRAVPFSEPLPWAQLSAPGCVLEVHEKHRGGKKPGRGWTKKRLAAQKGSGQAVAEGLIDELAKATQYEIRVDDRRRLQLLCGLVGIRAPTAAIVICSTRASRSALRFALLARGGVAEGQGCVLMGTCRLFLAAEVEAAPVAPMAGGTGETVAADQPPPGCALDLPADTCGSTAALVVTYDALREAASLASLMRTALWDEATTEVFHFTSCDVDLLIETEDERRLVDRCLMEGGASLKEELVLHQERAAPQGAAVVSALTSGALPGVLSLRRPAAARFVGRLRSTWRCSVPEVSHRGLTALLER